MKIRVKAFATLRDRMEKEIVLEIADGTTVAGLLDVLFGRYPGLRDEILDEDGELKKYVNVLKNGRNIYFLKNMSTVLDEGDDIALFPPVAGG